MVFLRVDTKRWNRVDSYRAGDRAGGARRQDRREHAGTRGVPGVQKTIVETGDYDEEDALKNRYEKDGQFPVFVFIAPTPITDRRLSPLKVIPVSNLRSD